MVSGSKVRAGTAGSVGAAPRYYRDEYGQSQQTTRCDNQVSLPPIHTAGGGGEEPDHQEQTHHGSSSVAGSSADMSLDLPLSFGEQLVLETYLRCKRRPYDRRRQDELSQPRRRAPAGEAWGLKGCSMQFSDSLDGTSMPNTSASKVTKRQMDENVNRLAQPKKSQISAIPCGESLALQSAEVTRSKLSRAELDEITSRLALPRSRAHNDTSGECVALHQHGNTAGRSVNLDRLAQMAKPAKRGASCRSWGVSSDLVRGAQTARPAESTELSSSGSKSARTPKREEASMQACVNEALETLAVTAATNPGVFEIPAPDASTEQSAEVPCAAAQTGLAPTEDLVATMASVEELIEAEPDLTPAVSNDAVLDDLLADLGPAPEHPPPEDDLGTDTATAETQATRPARGPSSFNRSTPNWAGGGF